MGFNWLTPVRGIQALFGLIVLGIAAYTVSSIDHDSLGTVTFNQGAYNVFVGLWSLLAAGFLLFVGLMMSDSFLANPIIILVVDGLSWVFWLAAFACMAAFRSDIDLACNTGQIDTFCGSCDAIIAFGVIEWFLFSATLGFNVFTSVRGGKASAGDAQGV